MYSGVSLVNAGTCSAVPSTWPCGWCEDAAELVGACVCARTPSLLWSSLASNSEKRAASVGGRGSAGFLSQKELSSLHSALVSVLDYVFALAFCFGAFC